MKGIILAGGSGSRLFPAPTKSGLAKTIDWFIANPWWWEPLRKNYGGKRLGRAS